MGTSLLDLDPNLAAFRQWQMLKDGGAHVLPPSVTTASQSAHMLPPSVTTASRSTPMTPHLLAAVHSVAPPMPAPDNRMQVGDINSVVGAMPVEQTPSSQGAIATMLHGLLAPPAPMPGAPSPAPQMNVGGQPMAGPQASPMPVQGPPPPQPSMMDRVKKHLSTLGDVQAPSGYDGLLSPDEIKSAQPGLLGRIASITPGMATPGQQYQSRLDHIIQLHQLASGVAEHQRVMGARQQMAQLFTPADNETEDQTRQRLSKMYAFAMAHGDEETMKDVGSTLRGIMTAPKIPGLQVVAPGGAAVDKDGNVKYQAPTVDKANDFTQYVDGKGDTHVLPKNIDPPSGWKPLSLDKTQITVNAASDRADKAGARADLARTDKITKDFTQQIKPLRERGAVIDQALKTLDDAAHNPNPAVRKTLYTSAVANFIQAADQKAQIRYQLLQYFKQNVDPSIGGKWEVLKNRLINGTLPGYTMEGMIGHLKNLRDLTQSEMDTQRAGLVKRMPELDLESRLPRSEEFFAPSSDAKPATAASTTYSPNNPFTKKK